MGVSVFLAGLGYVLYVLSISANDCLEGALVMENSLENDIRGIFIWKLNVLQIFGDMLNRYVGSFIEQQLLPLLLVRLFAAFPV